MAASSATFNFAFRGARIVAATLQDLVASHGLGSSPGTRLLFGGCSAGAIGAMNWLDRVPQLLGSAAAANVQLSGFLDGAALLDIPPRGWVWSKNLETLPSLISKMAALSNAQFPSYCDSQFPGAAYKCFVGQYRMPLINTVPFFVNAPQFDSFNLMVRGRAC